MARLLHSLRWLLVLFPVLLAFPASAQTAHNVTLKWVAPAAQTGVTVSGYNIYRSLTSNGQVMGTHINTTVETLTTYTDATVAAGTTYWYRVTTWCQPCT